MKKIVITLLAVICGLQFSLSATTEDSSAYQLKKSDCCRKVHAITTSDFKDSKGRLSKTYVIDKPDNYCLKCDVAFAPRLANRDAIEITVGNVSLDLSGLTLSQDPSNISPGTVGIYVAPNLSNVRIFNGTVSGFTGDGIVYDSGNDIITLDKLLVIGNGTGLDQDGNPLGTGIYLGPNPVPTDPALINTLVSNVTLTNSSILQNGNGLAIYASQGVYIDNIHVDESIGLNGDIEGIGNAGDPISVQVSAFLQDLQIYNSSFDRGQGIGANASAGLAVGSLANPRIIGCSFNDNKCNSIILSAGFVSGGLVNALIEECQFNNNSFVAPFPGAVPIIFNGFHTSANEPPLGLQYSTAITIRNSQANGNSSPGIVAGFAIYYQDNMLIENNRASNNRSLAQLPVDGFIAGFPVATGIFIACDTGISPPDSGDPSDYEGGVSMGTIRNNVLTDNVAEQGLGAGITWLGGAFYSDAIIQRNITFSDNIAQGNVGLADSPPILSPFDGGPYPPILGSGAGIIIDRGVIVIDDNVGLAFGQFPASAYSNITVENCTFNGNIDGAAGADAWISTASYIVGEVVSYSSHVYLSINGNGNVGQEPDISPSYWTQLTDASGQGLSGGLVLSGVTFATVNNNIAVGNTNGFVLTGGTTFNGDPIASSSSVLVRDNEAIGNLIYGFTDSNTTVDANAYILNTTGYSGVSNVHVGPAFTSGNINIP